MADTIFLEFEIHLRDEARVLELQGNPPGESSTQGSGATAQRAIIRAPEGAAEEFKGDNGGVVLPLIGPGDAIPQPVGTGEGFALGAYIYSRWFTSSEGAGNNFPTDAATFVRKSGGWFGIPLLFGNTKRFYWRGVFVYDPPLSTTAPDGSVIRQQTMKRRWIDPLAGNGFPNREEFGVEEITVDGAWVGALGYAQRGGRMASFRTHTMTDFTGGLADQVRYSWERIYLRLRRNGGATLLWRAGGTVDGSHWIQLNVIASGQLALYNGPSGTLIGTTEALEIDRIYKLDIAFGFGGAAWAPQDFTGGAGAPPGATGRCNVFLDGVSVINFTPAAGVGLGNTSFHLTSRIGTNGAGETADFDILFWMNAQNPIVFDGIDFINGSRAVLLKAKAFAAGHANWAGDVRLLNQRPTNYQDAVLPVVQGLTSSTALAELQVETDADRALVLPGAIGVAGIMITYRGYNGGGASGQLGYKIGAAARVMTTFNTNGLGNDTGTQNSPVARRLMYAPANGDYPIQAADLVPFEIHRVKGNDAGANGVTILQAVAELIGTFLECDYPATFDDDLKYPIPNRGYHNSPYPQSPWAQSSTPPTSPVVIKTGTYLGNGSGQDLVFPAPVHWIWIRKTTGAGNPTMFRWWSSMISGSVGGMKQPIGFFMPEVDVDPTFVPTGVEDSQEQRYRVRIAGSNLETNRAGDTYHYTAVMDPGMRFLMNVEINGSDASVPHVYPLPIAAWLAEGALILEQRKGNFANTEMFLKGPGHAANAANRLDASGASVNWLTFGSGSLTMQNAGAENYKRLAIAAMRQNDGSGDAGAARVFAFGSYVGNGAASRDIVHTAPYLSGRRPMWILIAPNGAQGHVKDCTMPATTSFAVDTGVTSTTAITGAALNQFTVGITLNENARTYHYMIIWGSETAGNGGMSACGEIWPVDPDPPDCIKIFDPDTGTWIDPPGGCDPEIDPPDVDPPDDPGDGDPDPPGNPGGGADDMGTDLAALCKPFTTRLANIALAKLGVSRRVVNLANTTAIAWSATRAYEIADAVIVGATTYYCIQAHVNHTPPNATYWSTAVPSVDMTTDAEQVRLHWAHAIKQTLRDYPWPFATRYAALALVGGTSTSPYNRDWRYAYAQPSDCVFERRIAVVREGAVDPTPPPFALTFNAAGAALITTHEVSPILEYTARPDCTASQADPLFVEAFTWKLAQLMAPAISKMTDREKYCQERYDECVFVKAPAVIKPGQPGMRPTSTPDTTAAHQAANVAVVNRGLIRIGARTIANMLGEQSREAEAARLIFEEELKSTLRDFPWSWATKYADTLELVRGPEWDDTANPPNLGTWSATVQYTEGDVVEEAGVTYWAIADALGSGQAPGNATYWTTDSGHAAALVSNQDWTYAYRLPTDVVDVRRIVRQGYKRGHDADPISFRIGQDARGLLLFTDEPGPTIEYTARLAGIVSIGDALFRDAFAWRLAASLAPSLATVDPSQPEQHGRGPRQEPKERKPTEAQLRSKATDYAWRMYAHTIAIAWANNANEQEPQKHTGDPDWIKGRQ